MAGPLKWILELYDRVSGPAEKMTKASEKFEKQMQKAAGSVDKMAHAQKELSAERIAVMTEVAHQAVEVFEHLTEKVVEFGREILTASDAERTNAIIFESLSGSAEEGAKSFSRAKEYASKAGISIAESVGLFRNLMTAGFKDSGDDLFILAQAAGDVALKTGSSAQSIVDSFAAIESQGQLTGRTLLAFRGAIPFEELAKRLGVASGSFHELQQQLNTNPVSAQKGIQAILDTLQQTEGGSLGNIRKRVGEGFEGATNRIKNAWEEALASFSKTEAFERVLRLMESIAKRLEDPAFGKAVADFASSMVTAAEAMANMVPSAQTLHNLFGGGIGEKLATNQEKALEQAQKGVGGNLKDWFDGGLVGKWFRERGKNNANEMVEGFSGPEGIDAHSPSRVFERLGGYSAEGFNIGYRASKDDSLAIPRLGPQSSGAPPRGHTMHVEQHFDIHSDGTLDVEQLAHRIAEISSGALQSPLENMSISLGAM